MTTMVTIKAGHDVAYFTSDSGKCSCAGAMSYYTAGGEPPGRWAGKEAVNFGLSGEVDPGVLRRLYQEDIAPTGEILTSRRQPVAVKLREAKAVAAFRKAHPFASAVEEAQVRVAERAKDPHRVPYFDVVITCVKSVSVLHASYQVHAVAARNAGDEDLAAELQSKAKRIENMLYEVSGEAVKWLQRHGCYTRTGHHGENTGEWRDGAGFVAPEFLHHLSRDGDPHLHMHIPVLNRVRRGDGADDKWRTLDSRSLHNIRLGLAAFTDRLMETKLAEFYTMVGRADGNGAEVGGVSQEVMDLFSSRSVAVTGETARLVAEFERIHGKPPSRRTIWQLHQQAGQNTRRSKAEAKRTMAGKTGSTEPTDGERLAAWDRQTTAREVGALSKVHEEAEAFALAHARRANPVLDLETKARAARVAVAEVQAHHATWSMSELRFEVGRALPRMPHTADAEALITEVAKLAVSGRAGTEVVQVTAPDVADVTELGVRKSDGGSVYRPPNEARYATLAQLDAEGEIIAAAKRRMPQLVSEADASAAVAQTDLNPEQADAVVKMLTSTTGSVVLEAPAGSGKSHTMGAFAKLWTQFTGKRVIGLTASTNAARVLKGEFDDATDSDLVEAYNIAQFLGKIEGSDRLRRPVPLHAGDVIVLDEATQTGTADYAMIQQAAREAGAFLIPVGDTKQLGAVDAGGMFRLLAGEVPTGTLKEIRRFVAQWERDASVRLRDGDMNAVATYATHGRIRGADEESAYDQAATGYLADLLLGKTVLLLAGSNQEAAELASRVQEKLIKLGKVGAPHIPLSDGNHAGRGDILRARQNTKIEAHGQPLTNRDTIRVEGWAGPDVFVRRQKLDGTWTERFTVPWSYLETDAELDYAGNVHVAEGRTVQVGRLFFSPSLSRAHAYVGMTRGTEENIAHVVTGGTTSKGHTPYQQATPEAVIKSVLQREDDELSATEHIRVSQEWTGGTGHVVNLWAASVRDTLMPAIDALIKAKLTLGEAARYDREPAKRVLTAKLREHQLAGHDLREVIGRITAGSMDAARSVSSVLHRRLEDLKLGGSTDTTWTVRTPETAPQLAHELAEALDLRRRELGERLADKPEPWLLRHLGVLAADASPELREDYARRVGRVAAYREAAGITDPAQAVAREPHRGNPELETLRAEAMSALEMIDEPVRYMTRGELEARILDGERAVEAAPEDVSRLLRSAAEAEQDARAQAADARVHADEAAAVDAEALADVVRSDRDRLEKLNATYDDWSARTVEPRALADEAARELARRGQAPEDAPELEEEPEYDPDAPGVHVETEEEFRGRLHRMIYGTDPEPEDDAGLEHQGEPESEEEFRERLHNMVHGEEGEEEPETDDGRGARLTLIIHTGR